MPSDNERPSGLYRAQDEPGGLYRAQDEPGGLYPRVEDAIEDVAGVGAVGRIGGHMSEWSQGGHGETKGTDVEHGGAGAWSVLRDGGVSAVPVEQVPDPNLDPNNGHPNTTS